MRVAHRAQRAGVGLLALRRVVWYKLKIFILDGLLRPMRPMDMLRFGTYYGGWWIPRLEPNEGAAFCVGAGLDVSFDLELQRLGYRVFTVDPTPASIEFLTENVPELTLLPVGVWSESGELEFRQDGDWLDSWAIGRAAPRGNGSVRRFPVSTVKDLVDSTGEQQISILKLDIEGAEHAVIRSLVRDNVKPASICVEFDDQRLRRVIASVRRLDQYGYDLYQIEGWNYTFVRRAGKP
jgi:FkbM family methyltransferase